MAIESLQALVGAAVVDESFRSALLGESRRQSISTFDLSPEELNAVLEIRADSLEQFARQLQKWVLTTQGQVEPPALTAAPRSFAGIPLARLVREPEPFLELPAAPMWTL